MNKLHTLLLLVISSLVYQLNAQEYALSEEQSVNVLGTSTLHDWKVSVPNAEGFPETLDINGTLSEFTFIADVKTMDGGRGASMNSKIHKALKNTEYPEITYYQKNIASITKKENDISILSNGILSIAGVENEVDLTIQGSLIEDQLVLKGTFPLKMTDYNIEPPSAMFGQIETDDKVEVVFEIKYLKK